MEKIDIAILFSEPFVTVEGNQVGTLDLASEKEKLEETFDEAGKLIEVRSEAATTENLSTVLTIGCMILHFSGHGSEKGELIFEGGNGEAQTIAASQFIDAVKVVGGNRLPKLVFVSSCHSGFSGDGLIEAGIQHVIGIRAENAIFDEAAQRFSKQFYLALLSGRSVYQAFLSSKMSVAMMPDEVTRKHSERFVIFPKDADSHTEILFEESPSGAWKKGGLSKSPGILGLRQKSSLAEVGRHEIS